MFTLDGHSVVQALQDKQLLKRRLQLRSSAADRR